MTVRGIYVVGHSSIDKDGTLFLTLSLVDAESENEAREKIREEFASEKHELEVLVSIRLGDYEKVQPVLDPREDPKKQELLYAVDDPQKHGLPVVLIFEKPKT